MNNNFSNIYIFRKIQKKSEGVISIKFRAMKEGGEKEGGECDLVGHTGGFKVLVIL